MFIEDWGLNVLTPKRRNIFTGIAYLFGMAEDFFRWCFHKHHFRPYGMEGTGIYLNKRREEVAFRGKEGRCRCRKRAFVPSSKVLASVELEEEEAK